MANNIVDRIGTQVTVWTTDGNAMENRKLLTLDTFGIVVSAYADENKAVFVPWVHVKYVDYANSDAKMKVSAPIPPDWAFKPNITCTNGV